MKTYELTYIISPEITSEEAEAEAKSIESDISSKEGMILRQSSPSAKTFAYPIGKQASGFFGILEFQLEPEKLPEFKKTIEKDGKIVRHMLIIKKPVKIKPERRSRTKLALKDQPALEPERKTKTGANEEEPISAKSSEAKEKVELKDIEHELDELLGE